MPFEILRSRFSKDKAKVGKAAKKQPKKMEIRPSREILGRFLDDLYQKNLHLGEDRAKKIVETFLEKNLDKVK